jgi:membrane fusion protein (multidrug efflux system)
MKTLNNNLSLRKTRWLNMHLFIKQFLSQLFIIISVFLMGCDAKTQAPMHGDFAMSVVAESVTLEKVEDRISLVGNLAADETVEIKNQAAGVIEKIGFKEGQMVKKGEILITIDAQKINAMLAQAEANLGLAQTTFERLASLITAGAISQQELDQSKSDLEAKKAEVDLIKAQLKETIIRSSFDGVMGERNVSLGQFIDQGTTLTYLISQNPIKAEFHVPEKSLRQLKTGQLIEVTVAAYPDETFKGEVYFIAPQLDEQTRTALVKAKLPNPDGKLRQGMFANLNLIVNVRTHALTIPEIALIPKGEEVYVFVIDSENKAQMKPVVIGLRIDSKVEITQGLSAGEKVVTEGHQKIGPGSLIHIKNDPAGEPPLNTK